MKKNWDNPREHAMPEHARVPASFSIGGVEIAPATVLAPMAGVTDTVFRRFIRNVSLFTTPESGMPQVRDPGYPASGQCSLGWEANLGSDVDAEISNQQSGCGLIMTEFTSADGLARMRESKRKRYLTFYDDEHPIAAQLFGSNPATLADAARIVQDTGFDLVDLNLGCPAKRVVACNGGSWPAPRPSADRQDLRDCPFSRHDSLHRQVPPRLGRPQPRPHPARAPRRRLRTERRRPPRAHPGAGLLRPGAMGTHCCRQRRGAHPGHRQRRHPYARRCRRNGRTDGLRRGDDRPRRARESLDFRQIAQYTAVGRYDQPTELDRYRIIRAYFQMLLETAPEDGDEAEVQGTGYEGRNYAQGKMKQFASWFTHGVPAGGALRKAIYECKSGPAILDAVENFFEQRSTQEERSLLCQE